MRTREEDIAKVMALPLNGNCKIFWSEEGGGEVHRIWDMLFLFEIPQYGGDARFEGAFHISEVEKLVDMAWTWT